MMKKENFYEGQFVVRLDHNQERGTTFYTVLEVHDSHIVLMHPRYGLDAVFYENPRTTYSPATRDEVKAQYEAQRKEAAKLRWEAQQIEVRCRFLADALLKTR